MTNLRHRFLVLEEVPDDLAKVRVIANMLGRPPAGNHNGHVVRRVYFRKRKIRVPAITRLLGVGLIAGFEVVDYEMQFLLRRRRNPHFVAFLLQTLVRIHHLKRLCCITRKNQYFWFRHGLSPLQHLAQVRFYLPLGECDIADFPVADPS